MSADPSPLALVGVTAPAWPALGALVLGALVLLPRPPAERWVARIALGSLWLSFASMLAATAAWLLAGPGALEVDLGHWFHAGDYGFELGFLVDETSVPVALLVGVLLLATSRFSVNYLHREPGFARFFLLVLVFGAGMLVLVLGARLELVFAGWEVVGMTSVLLVAFFRERSGPVRAAIRVLVTYRICDVGLVLGAVWLHLAVHTTSFAELGRLAAAPATAALVPTTAVGLALIVAAMGKSAQFPVGGWLPRAMEGPTASSAVFYGGLSVHAGVYLLLRTAPLLDASPVARTVLIVVGAVTAAMGALSGQVSADAKTALAHATISQVGLMFVECGLGLHRIALVHLVAHATLRYYQFLRTPSTLKDALARRAALGRTEPDEAAARWEGLGLGLRRFLYRLALERFAVEPALERWLVRPVLGASAWLDRLESRALGRLARPRRTKRSRRDATERPATETQP
ncbi:MAG: proton-conducting membrane transporter [Polyangiaceae bacterium]|nr:proton-conducting membrane transporter [Polyangiaceae bacterium]